MSGETQKEADPQASSVPPPSCGDISPSAPSDPATIFKSSTQPHGIRYTYILLAAFIVFVSGILVAVHLQAFLEDAKFRGVLVSPGMHKRLRGIVPRSSVDAGGPLEVPLMPIMGISMVGAFGTWLI